MTIIQVNPERVIVKTKHIKVDFRRPIKGRADMVDEYDIKMANEALLNEWLMIIEEMKQVTGVVEVTGYEVAKTTRMLPT